MLPTLCTLSGFTAVAVAIAMLAAAAAGSFVGFAVGLLVAGAELLWIGWVNH